MKLFRHLCLLTLACLTAYAQDFRATVSGQVTDKTGASIPGAKVTATQKNTNQKSVQITNQEGYYSITALIPSDYDMDVEAPGFKHSRKTNLTLLDSDKINLPF